MDCLKMLLNWLLEIFNSKIFATLAGVLIGFLMSEWKGRKSLNEQKRIKSLLGAAVVESLIEEVTTGYKLLLLAKQGEAIQHLLPSMTWSGMQTVNDDVLLRIIAVSHGVPPRGFPPRQIRTHCKNYFVNIVGQFNNAVQLKQSLKLFFTGPGSKFDEATKGVLDMLQQAKELLEHDAKSIDPKG